MESGGAEGILNEEERKRARAIAVNKAIRYFRDKKGASRSEGNVFCRRRYLATHLEVDESETGEEVLQNSNIHSLPPPPAFVSASPERVLSGCVRYTFPKRLKKSMLVF